MEQDFACKDKHQHKTQAKAVAHLRRFPADHRPYLSIYLCPDCGFWHVGHTPGNASRRKQRSIRGGRLW
jgi:rubrerythrin